MVTVNYQWKWAKEVQFDIRLPREISYIFVLYTFIAYLAHYFLPQMFLFILLCTSVRCWTLSRASVLYVMIRSIRVFRLGYLWVLEATSRKAIIDVFVIPQP